MCNHTLNERSNTILNHKSLIIIHRRSLYLFIPKWTQHLATDPSYSLIESQLRQVIYIPPTFKHGQKPPVILVPGSGATGFQSFDGNFIPLLTGVDYADPVWLNIPIQLSGDA
jgi:hypothetical protein